MGSSRLDTSTVFLGDVQHSTRLCAPLHCCFVLEPLPLFDRRSISVVVAAVKDRFSPTSHVHIHPSTEDKIIVSFENHQSAMLAIRTANEQRNVYVDGIPYDFQLDHTIYHLYTTLSDRRAILTIQMLPLHLRSHPVVEQILCQFCVLDYVPSPADSMEDESFFTCYVRSQRDIAFPTQIVIWVEEPTANVSPSTNHEPPVFLNSYTVTLITEEYSYEHGDISYAVPISNHSSESYIPYSLLDQPLMQALSASVMLLPRQGSSLTKIENIYALFLDISYIRIKVEKMYNQGFLLSLSRELDSSSLFNMLDTFLTREVQSGVIHLQPWTPSYGSTGSAISTTANIRVTGLPCNLFTPSIIQHLLSPFCMVKKHARAIAEAENSVIHTVSSYKCSVWCRDPRKVPRRIQAKLLPLIFCDPSSMTVTDHVFLRQIEICVGMQIN